MKKLKLFNIILSITFIFSLISCSTTNIVEDWNYEVQPLKVVQNGSLIKVWSYAKKQDAAIAKAKKYAVHAVVLKGYQGGNGVTAHSPLVNSEERRANVKFFENFFSDNGPYLQYATISNDGSIGASDRLKVGRNYKIGVIVLVQKEEIRKELERQGIIKPLNYGF